MKHQKIFLVLAIIASTAISTQASASPLAAGWTSIGNAGSSTSSDGVVTMPVGFAGYNYVSTSGGVTGNTLPGIAGSTNGSTATSAIFSATTGDLLKFDFNYVTSDGAGFSDYAWARLLDSSNIEVAMLFNARTTPTGNTVPGFGLGPITGTIIPASTPIIAGATTWSALGTSSGTCFDDGCGYTGWVSASYTMALTGNYHLQFGVANVGDTGYQSGLAFAGTTIAGVSIDPVVSAVPVPAAIWLFGSALAGFIGFNRRKSA